MKKIVLFILLISSAICAGDIARPKITMKKTDSAIKLDGIVDPIWSRADSACEFFQQQPAYGSRTNFSTIAKILSNEKSLYCLIIAYDSTGRVQANQGIMDETEGDIVSIYLDTYDDKRTAYRFAVNAAGVKTDCRMIDDGRNIDMNWDGVWFAASKMYSWGYVVEMEIPYKSISYNKNLGEWGIDFDRWIPHATEDIYWSRYEQNEGMRVSKFGRLAIKEVKPESEGLNLEIYPVGIANMTRREDGKYNTDADAGIDIFYNPSTSLTYQLTVNPDFAQIEADPYDFNISRYETYFDEKRPFFTQGNEVFLPSGKEKNSGFYKPLELFYSRRIGKKLTDGSEVPLVAGTKAFGRLGSWEYGGFLATTGQEEFKNKGMNLTEDRAYFGVARLKKQILGNSTIGVMFVGKQTKNNRYGVFDIDGAFRSSSWQLGYQIARSYKNDDGGFAVSSGLRYNNKSWILMSRLRYVGEKFDINEIGYVPWVGTTQSTTLTGPVWYFQKGAIRSIMLYFGPYFNYEKVDGYTDHSLILGYNMQFSSNFGFEVNSTIGKSRDAGQEYPSYDITFSSWFDISPKWSANVNGGHEKIYNFSRNYQATDQWLNASGTWVVSTNLKLGTDINIWMERKPGGAMEDITYNARPFISVVPINNMNIRVYVDNVYLRSTDHLESVIGGLLFSYNFLPKSWIYFAFNEVQSRDLRYDVQGRLQPLKMHVTDRASVFKIKYLYYF